MASAPVKAKLFSWRYLIAKLAHAGVESVHQLRGQAPSTLSEAITSASSKFRATFEQRMTSVMYMAGNAMAPTLNKAALTDPGEVEKLVVRTLPRPSARNVLVGDVVAFNSPLALRGAEQQAIMVRRVAAMEGATLVAEDSTDTEELLVPKDHFWALGDNEELAPREAMDSRTFGFVPLRNIIGRVIYAASTATEHAPVANHPLSVLADAPIIEHEVDTEALWPLGSTPEEPGRGPRGSHDKSADQP